MAVAFSPDGKTVLTGSADGMAQLWDAATGNSIGKPLSPSWYCHHRGVQPRWQDRSHRQLGQDGAALGRRYRCECQQASGARRFCRGGRVQPRRQDHCDWQHGSGRRGSGTHSTGIPIGGPLPASRLGHGTWPFSPDGKTILTGSADGTVQLWDASTGMTIGQRLVHLDGLVIIAFSPDGNTFVTVGRDNTARLWDVTSGMFISRTRATSRLCARLWRSAPTARRFITGSTDRTSAALGRGHWSSHRQAPAAIAPSLRWLLAPTETSS